MAAIGACSGVASVFHIFLSVLITFLWFGLGDQSSRHPANPHICSISGWSLNGHPQDYLVGGRGDYVSGNLEMYDSFFRLHPGRKLLVWPIAMNLVNTLRCASGQPLDRSSFKVDNYVLGTMCLVGYVTII
jgi:hypothetical protein